MVNTCATADNLLWFMQPSHNGSSESLNRSKNLAASALGSSSTIGHPLTLSLSHGARRRGEYSTLNLGSVYGIYLANMGRQENIVFCW